MAKDPPKKAKPPLPAGEPSGSKDVTSSQIVSTRDLGRPPLPPPPVRGQQRRSTTHGVDWYATEDDDDLGQPRRVRRRTIVIVALVTVGLAGAAGAYFGVRARKPSPVPVAAVAVAPDAAPPAPDAAPVRMVKVGLASTPPGADFVVDGKPVEKGLTEIEVAEKSKLVVEATLAGHQPWREEVQLEAKGKKIMARLVAIPADAGLPAAEPALVKPSAKPTAKTPVKKVIKKKVPAKAKKKRPIRK